MISRRHDRGAAAVEMALVLPVLMLLVFGIINYGLWFNDSLSVRQGVREAARRAVVLNPSGCAGTTMDAYVCSTKTQLTTLGGGAAAKVFVASGGTWARGGALVVCGVAKAVNFTGFVPLMPTWIKSETTMSIEATGPVPPAATPVPPTTFTAQDTDPSGGNWGWCT